MKKKKHKETAYEESLRSALVDLRGAQDKAREAFNRAFERLEGKASGRLDKIVREAREQATVLATALQKLLAESHAAVAELSDGAATECAAAVQRVEGAAAEREAAVERVYTETTDRILASQNAIEQQTQQLAAIIAEAQGHRVAMHDARAATEAVASELETRGRERPAVADRRSQESLAELDGVVAELRERAATECAVAVQRVEDAAAEREAAVERVYTETTDRILASQNAIEQQTQQLGEHAARHVAELLVVVDGNVQELHELARLSMEKALTAVDEKFSAVLTKAVERSNELLTQPEADGQALRDQREQSDRVATSLAENAHRAPDFVAEAGDVDQHADDSEDARFVDSQHPEIEGTERAFAASVQTQPTVGADEEEATFANDAPSEAADDENFFSRLAAELRDNPDQGEFPRSDDQNDEVSTWAPAPAGTVLSPSGSAQQAAVLETSTAQPVDVYRAATKAVTVSASLAALTACVEQLARGAAEQSLRMELASAAPQRNGGSYLRLTAYDSAGWWEYHDIEGTADSDAAAPAVVDIGELREALGALDRFVGGTAVQIVLDGNVTIGNHLLMARDANEVPALSEDRKAIERVDLQGASGFGLVIESQIGRIFVPRDLLGCLRRRQACAVELIMVDGLPCISAQVNDPSGNPAGMIVARLQELGEHDVPAVAERRNTHENAVTQLVSALSTATTPLELSRILKVGVGYVRRRAAAHPALNNDIILDLIREGTEAMRAAAASNVSIGKVASDLAGADPSSLVRATVAANPAVRALGLERLAADPVAQVRAHAASNPVITPDLLEQLAEDGDSSVRAAVASNERVELETLLVLARDPDPSVCAAVASNPICPADVLNELVGIVPASVLANPNASKTLLVAGSIVDEPRLRATVAANPATPTKRLRKLAQDKDLDVLRAIADHAETPRSARRRARRQLEERTGKPNA